MPGCTFIRYEQRPLAFGGGTSNYTAASVPAVSRCQNVAAGDEIIKSTANAITFTNGLKIDSVIGIDLSAKAGFNTRTKISHLFITAGQICGTNANYLQANTVVAK